MAKEKKSGKSTDSFFVRAWKAIVTWVNGIISELKKVTWPSKKDLIAYTTLVVVFVLIMTAIIGIYDLPLGLIMKNWLL